MKTVFIVGSAVAAFFFELTVGTVFSWGDMRIPFLAFCLSLWFFRLGFGGRVWLAGVGGILAESISLAPFGAYIAVFLLLSVGVEWWRSIVIHQESMAARAIGVMCLLSLFSVSMMSVNFFILSGTSLERSFAFPIGSALLVSLFWSFVLPALFFGTRRLVFLIVRL